MLASELRHKATVNWERIWKQSEAARDLEIKKGYDCLLKQMSELAENGRFSHTFRGGREACTIYMCSLNCLGYRVSAENLGMSLAESDEPTYLLTIDWH